MARKRNAVIRKANSRQCRFLELRNLVTQYIKFYAMDFERPQVTDVRKKIEKLLSDP